MIEVLLFILMGLSFLCFIRVLLGPTMADRMVAIDIFGILVVGICALLIVKTGRLFLIDVAIAWIMLSFIGTIALGKYLTRKKLDE
ncbi:MAG: monovalent cation/H+ antiporter complex subunit F [Candidatus Cloacimonadaceae bacterium]|nr:monovalent cation/H+ antiporter complex subunit F [Candidatus Cloacimonadaceae bacterium]